jgi:transketolase
MRIIVPCDGPQTRDAIIACANNLGPFYVRLGRSKVASVENKGEFQLGKAQVLAQGKDVTIIACGLMVETALSALENLAKKGIKARLLNMHTVKPLDSEAILESAVLTGGIVVCEEHSISGGLASSVDEIVAENHPTRVVRVGVKNRFGQSGEPADLLKEYNLTSLDIEKAALSVCA